MTLPEPNHQAEQYNDSRQTQTHKYKPSNPHKRLRSNETTMTNDELTTIPNKTKIPRREKTANTSDTRRKDQQHDKRSESLAKNETSSFCGINPERPRGKQSITHTGFHVPQVKEDDPEQTRSKTQSENEARERKKRAREEERLERNR